MRLEFLLKRNAVKIILRAVKAFLNKRLEAATKIQTGCRVKIAKLRVKRKRIEAIAKREECVRFLLFY